VKFAGTRINGENALPFVVDALKTASYVRSAARELGTSFSKLTQYSPEILATLFTELYLRCPHIRAYSQLSYISPTGQPFLSTFALLRKWDSEIANGRAALAICELITDCVSSAQDSQLRPNSIKFEAYQSKDGLRIGSSGREPRPVEYRDLENLFNYFHSALAPEYHFPALRNRTPERLVTPPGSDLYSAYPGTYGGPSPHEA